MTDFNPQGSREPRPAGARNGGPARKFQSTRLSRASTVSAWGLVVPTMIFQSTRLSRASTRVAPWVPVRFRIFQSTRLSRASTSLCKQYICNNVFQSTRLSRASTAKMHNYSCIYATFTCFILYIFYKSFFKLKFPRVI